MAIIAKVFGQSVYVSAPDPDGARAVRYESKREPMYVGTLGRAAAYLEKLPIGVSVEVRYYVGERFSGSRSCMNKPALWDDLRWGARHRKIPSIRAARKASA